MSSLIILMVLFKRSNPAICSVWVSALMNYFKHWEIRGYEAIFIEALFVWMLYSYKLRFLSCQKGFKFAQMFMLVIPVLLFLTLIPCESQNRISNCLLGN